MDFDAFDQAADNVTFGLGIDRGQSALDQVGEIFEPADDQKQLLMGDILLSTDFDLLRQLLDLQLQLLHLGLEVRGLDNAIGVAVDQP